MQYRKIAKTKDTLSVLDFGCMCFPTFPDKTIDEKQTTDMVCFVKDTGVNYIGTAWALCCLRRMRRKVFASSTDYCSIG